jgi:predicted type IV restriction endonuclease
MKINTNSISELILKFENLEPVEKNNYSEADVGTKFVLPLLEILGWNKEKTDPKEIKEQKRDTSGKPTDYLLCPSGIDKIVVEIKSFNKSLDDYYLKNGTRKYFAQQAIDYAFNLQLDWAILTNFKEIRLYHTHVRNPEDGLIFSLKYDELVDSISDLDVLSKERVELGTLNSLKLKRDRSPIEIELTSVLKKIRKQLQETIVQKNNLSETNLRLIVQSLIDRLVVLRVAEDREIIGSDTLRLKCSSWKDSGMGELYPEINVLFNQFHSQFGTKVFGKPLLDDKKKELSLDSAILFDVINQLYSYNFDEINADVLGNVYENFLTVQLMELKSGHFQIVDSSRQRRSLGAYYTPHYLIEFIVDKTLRPILDKCQVPEDVEKIKVCDPSCGSGSFLIQVFDLFKKWYEQYNSNILSEPGRIDSYADPRIVHDIGNRILENNIFGVDIDPQACEIASINLLLKALKKDSKIPDILDKIIRNGNSQITGNESEFLSLDENVQQQMKAFDWKKEFPGIKFDVIVGNPPYFKIKSNDKNKISDHYEKMASPGSSPNMALLFLSKSEELLSTNGKIGLVLPKVISYLDSCSKARELIFEKLNCEYVIDCEKAFKNVLFEEILLIGEHGSKNNFFTLGVAIENKIQNFSKIEIEPCFENDRIFLEPSIVAEQIRKKIMQNGVLYSELLDDGSITMRAGLAQLYDIKSDWIQNRTSNCNQILFGKNIQRYMIENSAREDYLDKNHEFNSQYRDQITEFAKPHIEMQRIFSHIQNNESPFTLLKSSFLNGDYIPIYTTTCIFPNPEKFDLFFILGVLNSRIVSYFAWKFIFCNAVRSMDLYEAYLRKLPFPIASPKQQKEISTFVKHLTKHLEKIVIKPNRKNYFIAPEVNRITILDILENKKGTEIIINDQTTGGRLIDYDLSVKDDWVIINAQYFKSNSITKHNLEILRINEKNKSIRDYVLFYLKEKNRSIPARERNLYRGLVSEKLPSFDNSLKNNFEKISQMMNKFDMDSKEYDEWLEEFKKLDQKIDLLVSDLFHLETNEFEFILHSSRPDWHVGLEK